jgi:hypothetical protein
MPDLETLLEETRPRPRPEFTERLERRVEAGFPKEPRRRRTPSLFRPAFALACTVLLVGIAVAVVTSRSGEDGQLVDSFSRGDSAESAPAPSAAEPAPSAAESLPPTPLPPVADGVRRRLRASERP